MIVFLTLIALNAVYITGHGEIIHFIIITGSALIADGLIKFVKSKKLEISETAIISAMIIALIVSHTDNIALMISLPVIAMISKHIIRWKGRTVFNPAALSLVLGFFIFRLFPSWWGVSTFLTLPLGLFIAYKIRKLEIAFSFLATYLLLFIGNALISSPEIFQPPSIFLLNLVRDAYIFFAFYMLTEPMTTPFSKRGKIIFGVLVGVLSFGFSLFVKGIDFFLLSLLIANLTKEFLNKI